MTDPARAARLPGARLRVAAAHRRTATIGQQSYNDVLWTHPDVVELDRACAAWEREGGCR